MLCSSWAFYTSATQHVLTLQLYCDKAWKVYSWLQTNSANGMFFALATKATVSVAMVDITNTCTLCCTCFRSWAWTFQATCTGRLFVTLMTLSVTLLCKNQGMWEPPPACSNLQIMWRNVVHVSTLSVCHNSVVSYWIQHAEFPAHKLAEPKVKFLVLFWWPRAACCCFFWNWICTIPLCSIVSTLLHVLGTDTGMLHSKREEVPSKVAVRAAGMLAGTTSRAQRSCVAQMLTVNWWYPV